MSTYKPSKNLIKFFIKFNLKFIYNFLENDKNFKNRNFKIKFLQFFTLILKIFIDNIRLKDYVANF